MMRSGKFSRTESFLFYRFLPECLVLDKEYGTELSFDLGLLDEQKLKFNEIYLNYAKLKWTKDKFDLFYYYPDILERTAFDATTYD
jgi:hypothetical protein